MIPTGTFTQNTHRHPTDATRSPPSAGPDASPSACAAACAPSAARAFALGTLVTTIATLLAWSMAAPNAWTTRKTMSQPTVGASAQAAEAAVNTAKP